MARVRDLSGNLASNLDPANGYRDRNAGQREGKIMRSVAVVCSDVDDIASGVTNALKVTTAGNYTVMYVSGETAVENLAAAVWHPMNVRRVLSSGAASTTGVTAGY